LCLDCVCSTSRGWGPPPPPARGRTSGVSLIEALLALVVLSLGMLAVVGVQTTLRASGDLSRQRAEAVRLAQEALETWRTFSSVTALAGVQDFTDIADTAATNITPAGANATYTLTRQVAPVPASGSPPLRTFSVTVDWVDRAGENQQVQLFSSVARVSPALAASLSVPPNGGPALRPLGRHAGIPRGATASSAGTSIFTPPQPAGTSDITTLEFNNISGDIVCIRVNGGPCGRGRLLSGLLSGPGVLQPLSLRVDFKNAAGAVAVPATPKGPARDAAYDNSTFCFLGSPVGTAMEYFCALPLAQGPGINIPAWSGKLVVFYSATPNTAESICRYGLNPNPIAYPYADVLVPLSNQNFELLAPGAVCPSGSVPA
jgi:hypothetical protein